MTNQLMPVDQFRREIASPAQIKAIKAVLPDHISPEQFCRVAVMAVTQTPSLLNADRQSLFASLQKCATDGLIPDNKEAALIEFKKNIAPKGDPKQFVTKIQYLPMVSGILKRARQSGQISTIAARCVYENDSFDYWIDENGEHLTHRPKFGGDRGKITLVYAMAKMTTGEVVVEPMDMNEINKVKNASKTSKFGPWVDWFERMAEKSALHRLARRLPNSSELSEMMDRDNWMYDFNKPQDKISLSNKSFSERLGKEPDKMPDIDTPAIENSDD